ncbi:NADPH-dependent FMN reductase [Vibrio fluminensis]|uniref:NADPH-dependent FMN reductase n=1 Tax=Vibrio fluminensis TaxID=2783614 RepID=UPI0018888501|nr:NAD(P)H-dependent oxidoreductase [Vibrio fluminensis]
MKTILTISASNRAESINAELLNYAVKHISNVEVSALNMQDVKLPFYNQDLEASDGIPSLFESIRPLLDSADGYILACPEHNGLMPAEFKNFLDWLSRVYTREKPAFGGKPMLLISTSPGENGGATNLATLARLLPWQGANIVASYSLGNFYQTFEQDKISEQEHAAFSTAINNLTTAVNVG